MPCTTPDARVSRTYADLPELPMGFEYALWPFEDTAEGHGLNGDRPLFRFAANPSELTTGNGTTYPGNVRYIEGIALVIQPIDIADLSGAVVLASDPPLNVGAGLITDHSFATGADFLSVAGQYVVESFSTLAAEDWFTGIWWV
ncbi:MAG: hypothetical protein GWP91_02150 [Rhodobacterales bacterium]|nr:hypothetical protein [Rhodobacterales bacterium]